MPPGAVPARADDQRERLAAFDLPSELTDWISSGARRGGTVRYFNLDRIARYL